MNPALAAGRRCLTSVSVATGPSARGRTGSSGALANSSASSSGAAAGSPTRTAHSTPIRSSSSERASNASHRSDGASAQWTSSTTRTAGPSSPRLLTSHTNPWAAACIASPAGAGAPPSGASARSASPAAPVVSSSHSGRIRSGSNSCSAIPHAACCSSGLQRADSTIVPSAPAARPAATSNVDLPIPAGPSTTITRPEPGTSGGNSAAQLPQLSVTIQQDPHRHKPYLRHDAGASGQRKDRGGLHDALISVGADHRGSMTDRKGQR